MATLTYRRLDPRVAQDRLEWRQVFRGTASFTHATEGRAPSDADADRMIDALPKGKTAEDVFLYAIYASGVLCGCAYLARDYPRAGDSNLVLVVLMERYQGSYLGVRVLCWLEAQAGSWGCTRLTGVVDTANQKALRFWQRLGFQEERRQKLPGLVAEGVVGFLPVSPGRSSERTSSRRLRRLAGT